MLQLALPLAAAGFPFLKRSLLGKLSHVAPREETLATLAARIPDRRTPQGPIQSRVQTQSAA